MKIRPTPSFAPHHAFKHDRLPVFSEDSAEMANATYFMLMFRSYSPQMA